MRAVFPEDSLRLVYSTEGYGHALRAASGVVYEVYLDQAGTTLADIHDLADQPIIGSTLTVNAESLLPLFKGPEDVEILYLRQQGTLGQTIETAAAGISLVGPQGDPGPIGTGVPGPPGADGLIGPSALGAIVFVQPTRSDHWHIVHGRGSNPSVVLIRSDGAVVGGFGLEYPDVNTVDIRAGLISGQAILNF